MSLALFRSTLRTAIRDALAEEAAAAPGQAPRAEPPAPLIEARPLRCIGRLDLVVNASLGARGQAS